ncbi:MAG: guanylate kinase [Lachnospiraceae bacterium]|nr:guanylate kinase [Clostridiales bacterium]MDD6293464.1 guanylate kinase [Eubacteriales bacterium]MDY2608076.1 guanylate kinase [Lachnospiraceae bacterium]
MGRIFYVMGKSSAGKDTIYKMLVNDKELGLKTIVGYTTRPMREGEVNGREYFFVDEDELKKLEQAGKVIEKRGYNTVYGVWNYFTVDDENINLNENNYILIGTLESYRNVRDYYGNEVVVPIYIEVEDGVRLIRAINREMTQNTPKYEELCRRFLADAKDFAEDILDELDIKKRYNNENLNKCYEEIKGEIMRLKQ